MLPPPSQQESVALTPQPLEWSDRVHGGRSAGFRASASGQRLLLADHWPVSLHLLRELGGLPGGCSRGFNGVLSRPRPAGTASPAAACGLRASRRAAPRWSAGTPRRTTPTAAPRPPPPAAPRQPVSAPRPPRPTSPTGSPPRGPGGQRGQLPQPREPQRAGGGRPAARPPGGPGRRLPGTQEAAARGQDAEGAQRHAAPQKETHGEAPRERRRGDEGDGGLAPAPGGRLVLPEQHHQSDGKGAEGAKGNREKLTKSH